MDEEWTGPHKSRPNANNPIDVDDLAELERLGQHWCVSVRDIEVAIALVGPMREAVAYRLGHRTSTTSKDVTDEVRNKIRLRAAHRSAYWLARKVRTTKVDRSLSSGFAELRVRVAATEQAMTRFMQDLEDHRVVLIAASAAALAKKLELLEAEPGS